MAFRDQGAAVYNSWPHNFRASVMKFDGANWVYVGTPGFSSLGSGAQGALYTSLAIDANGTLYVAYSDFSNNSKATVMKFDGSNWVNVGAQGFSIGTVNNTSIVLDSQGTPYVGYIDGANGGKATVMKYNGSSWVPVGTPGLSPGVVQYTSLKIDLNNNLYLAFADNTHNEAASVMKFDGNSWSYLGTPGFSDSTAMYTTIAVDNNTGTLYAAYEVIYNTHAIYPLYPIHDATVKMFSTATDLHKQENSCSMSIYPNPTSKAFTIDIATLDSKSGLLLKVNSSTGQTIYSESIKKSNGSSFTKQIDLSQFPKGTYFIELLQGNKQITKKLILQ